MIDLSGSCFGLQFRRSKAPNRELLSLAIMSPCRQMLVAV